MDFVRSRLFLVLVVSGLSAVGQTGGMSAVVAPPPGQTGWSTGIKHTDELKQELDVNAAILSRIPADPLIRPDPLGPLFRPVDNLSEGFAQSHA